MLTRLLALDEDDPPIPVLAALDAQLAAGETDGWRYEDMPPADELWRRSLHHLDDDARQGSGAGFAALAPRRQRQMLEAVRTAGVWHGLRADRVWAMWMRYACTALYSHPRAWNDIGFGGPAYPVGYANLGLDRREHWEVAERDAFDPEPWAQRVEAAVGRHTQTHDDDTHQPPGGQPTEGHGDAPGEGRR